IATDAASVRRGPQPLLDARYILLRHRAADDLILELETASARKGLEANLDARELARAAALLLVLDALRDRLAIGDRQAPHAHLRAGVANQAIDGRLEMALAGAGEDRPLRLRLDPIAERRVLIGKRGQGRAQLGSVRGRLRINRDRDD